MRYIILTVMATMSLAGCKSKQPTVRVEVDTTRIEVDSLAGSSARMEGYMIVGGSSEWGCIEFGDSGVLTLSEDGGLIAHGVRQYRRSGGSVQLHTGGLTEINDSARARRKEKRGEVRHEDPHERGARKHEWCDFWLFAAVVILIWYCWRRLTKGERRSHR